MAHFEDIAILFAINNVHEQENLMHKNKYGKITHYRSILTIKYIIH